MTVGAGAVWSGVGAFMAARLPLTASCGPAESHTSNGRP